MFDVLCALSGCDLISFSIITFFSRNPNFQQNTRITNLWKHAIHFSVMSFSLSIDLSPLTSKCSKLSIATSRSGNSSQSNRWSNQTVLKFPCKCNYFLKCFANATHWMREPKRKKERNRNTRDKICLLSSQKEICLRCACVVFSIYLCNIDFMLCHALPKWISCACEHSFKKSADLLLNGFLEKRCVCNPQLRNGIQCYWIIVVLWCSAFPVSRTSRRAYKVYVFL